MAAPIIWDEKQKVTGNRVTVDPITRLEGHGKIEIFLDDSGNVKNAYWQVPEVRDSASAGGLPSSHRSPQGFAVSAPVLTTSRLPRPSTDATTRSPPRRRSTSGTPSTTRTSYTATSHTSTHWQHPTSSADLQHLQRRGTFSVSSPTSDSSSDPPF